MADRDQDRFFTLVFEGDIAKFPGNPFSVETTFGRPVAAARGGISESLDIDEEAAPVLPSHVVEQASRLAETIRGLPGNDYDVVGMRSKLVTAAVGIGRTADLLAILDAIAAAGLA